MFFDLPLPDSVTNALTKFNQLTQGNSIQELEDFTPEKLKEIIQQAELANLIIPTELAGQGCNLDELLMILHRIAQTSPSISIMLCMHYHVVCTLSAFPDVIPAATELLTAIAKNNHLIASAFSEGVPGMNIFDSSVMGTTSAHGIDLTGSKRPCSMTSIADYYAVSMVVDQQYAGIAIVHNGMTGISHKAFWPSDILKATDSNQVVFDHVVVEQRYTKLASPEELEGVLSYGLASFNLMINAAYSGASVALANKLPAVALKNTAIVVELQGKLMTPFYSGMGLATALSNLENIELTLNNILMVRFQNQKTLKEIAALVNENIGALGYLADPEVILLGALANLMAFHPMSRFQFEQLLAQKYL